jgi:hypothetical protein
MKTRAFVLATLLVLAGAGTLPGLRSFHVSSAPVLAQVPDRCGPRRRTVEIREADPAVDRARHDQMRNLFIQSANQPDTTILLGPNVVLDFSGIPDDARPSAIGRCVTIRSVAFFRAAPDGIRQPGTAVFAPAEPPPARGTRIGRGRGTETTIDARGRASAVFALPPGLIQTVPDARSSLAPGPQLKFGPHRSSGDKAFLQARCFPREPDQADHIRLSGFRVFGPDMGQQDAGDKGILIDKCVDVEITNMEVAGFGGEAIRVQDDPNEYFNPPILAEAWQLRGIEGVCREPPFNGPEGRIGSPDQVRIIGNYIHNNQQPRGVLDSHAGGYGVEVTYGAHARISQNLFSANRHSIAAGGTMGGYEATQNLVLRYGGVHFDTIITIHTHAFDIHGTGDNGFDGWAGARTTYSYNAFQYSNGNAIKVRGSPRCGIEISHNVFPHHGLEKDWGADAVALQYRQDIGAIQLGPDNRLDTQTYGEYGVCDFDGDGVDDLFLATGVSWWFSGLGEFPWRFLSLRNERLSQLRFGYFDADQKCDVLTESNGAWLMSSGGTGEWARVGQMYAPLSEVAFGQFDPNRRDHRVGATRPTTHAFWRTANGQWKVTRVSGPGQGWRDVASSSFPMSALRFGDFDGDGVTDVLAVESGHWAISSAAVDRWRRLNPTLGDDVRGLFIADVDNNNKDDLIRRKYRALPVLNGQVAETIEWEISYDGVTPWKPLTSYQWLSPGFAQAPFSFAGRFGTAPGAGVLTIDRGGTGLFFAPLETRVGANPNWTSTFRY